MNCSKWKNCVTGVYLPVTFTTSCAAIPPKKAAIGEITLSENQAIFVIIFLTSSSICSSLKAFSFYLRELLISSAIEIASFTS